jgi:hypothetical protein
MDSTVKTTNHFNLTMTLKYMEQKLHSININEKETCVWRWWTKWWLYHWRRDRYVCMKRRYETITIQRCSKSQNCTDFFTMRLKSVGNKGLSLPEIKSRFLILPFLCQHEHLHRGTHTGIYTHASNIVRRAFSNYASHAGGSVCWQPQDMRRTASCLTANPTYAFAWVLHTKVQEERSNSRHNLSEW